MQWSEPGPPTSVTSLPDPRAGADHHPGALVPSDVAVVVTVILGKGQHNCWELLAAEQMGPSLPAPTQHQTSPYWACIIWFSPPKKAQPKSWKWTLPRLFLLEPVQGTVLSSADKLEGPDPAALETAG